MNREEKLLAIAELPGFTEEVYDEFLVSFCNQTNDKLKVIKTAWENKDFNTLHDLIHTIKGTSGNLYITRVYQTSLEIEDTLKNAADPDRIESSLNKLQDEITNLEKSLGI